MVRADEDAHAADADNDAENLEEAVAHAEEEEGDDDHHHDGPEVDELCAEDVGVAVRQDGEVVALDIKEGHDEVLPAISVRHLKPGFGALLVHKVRGIDEGEQHVVEHGLEGGDRGADLAEERGEGVGRGDAEGEDLPDDEDDPEIAGQEVGVPFGGACLEEVKTLADGGVILAGNVGCIGIIGVVVGRRYGGGDGAGRGLALGFVSAGRESVVWRRHGCGVG